MTAFDGYLSAGQHSLQANSDLCIASVGLVAALWAEAIAPFYRCAWDFFDMSVKIALPANRSAADLIPLKDLRTAREKKAARRATAIIRG